MKSIIGDNQVVDYSFFVYGSMKFVLVLIFKFDKIDRMDFFTAITGSITALSAFGALCFSIHTFTKNQKLIRIQHFESTFFNMMNHLEDIVNDLRFNIQEVTPKEESILNKKGIRAISPVVKKAMPIGRDVFKFLYKSIRLIDLDKRKLTLGLSSADVNKFQIIDKISESNKYSFIEPLGYENVIRELGILGFEFSKDLYVFIQYYQYLYQIMKFVDEATFLDKNSHYIDGRYKYTSIIRATLSPYELVFLFYYGLTFSGQDFKHLAEKYSMYLYLDTGLLANSRRDKELNLYEDGFINDGERFKSKRIGDKDKYYQSIYVKDPDLFRKGNAKI